MLRAKGDWLKGELVVGGISLMKFPAGAWFPRHVRRNAPWRRAWPVPVAPAPASEAASRPAGHFRWL
ncbi:hypothetical protein GCM10011335_40770 [Aureimonas glaciei]|uniref:Uncharacterized protein n=1 Tax=Aureimonas glaciei TaxID=1776957 RepID=A0A916Y8K5_9HYPH|nr:hypothetical protein GCM10011335_40770 [Aureimonas glaciei]